MILPKKKTGEGLSDLIDALLEERDNFRDRAAEENAAVADMQMKLEKRDTKVSLFLVRASAIFPILPFLKRAYVLFARTKGRDRVLPFSMICREYRYSCLKVDVAKYWLFVVRKVDKKLDFQLSDTRKYHSFLV
ncbi:unnamed protein product [Gongylonema pulchrum]|uniref:Uncharacterized protein n=1 Tax=Gongylonema pulchrum TaxID=637853 RepID=A0A183D5J2_9BILA|nr:unnamed protein product [Gongylonema pulchrum]